MKNAGVEQREAVRQHGVSTIVGLKKGLIAPINPVEEQLLARRGGGNMRQPPGTGQSSVYSNSSCLSRSEASSEGWGSTAGDELDRIHELGNKARALGRKGAHAHNQQAMRQVSEDELLHPDGHY
jgi:hypothetical protein